MTTCKCEARSCCKHEKSRTGSERWNHQRRTAMCITIEPFRGVWFLYDNDYCRCWCKIILVITMRIGCALILLSSLMQSVSGKWPWPQLANATPMNFTFSMNDNKLKTHHNLPISDIGIIETCPLVRNWTLFTTDRSQSQKFEIGSSVSNHLKHANRLKWSHCPVSAQSSARNGKTKCLIASIDCLVNISNKQN